MSEPLSILPPNASAAERAIERGLRTHPVDLTPLSTLFDPETCPRHLPPYLAHAYSVDTWDPDWSEATKRSVIAGSLEVHRRKGTVGAVRRALAAAGFGDASILEGQVTAVVEDATRLGAGHRLSRLESWAEYEVEVGAPITAAEAAILADVVGAAAPVRSHLRRVKARVGIAVGEDRDLGDGWTLGASVELETAYV